MENDKNLDKLYERFSLPEDFVPRMGVIGFIAIVLAVLFDYIIGNSFNLITTLGAYIIWLLGVVLVEKIFQKYEKIVRRKK